MKLFIILCVQFLAVNIAYATNNLNGNLNNNNNQSQSVSGSVSGSNAEINAGYRSDTTVNNSTNIPVSGAYAPLAIPTSDCMGSFSAGGQGQFMGLSLGFTKQSKPCNIRAYAKMFYHKPEIYNAILCQDDIVRKAFEAAGESCPEIIKDAETGLTIVYEYPRGR